MFLVALPKDRLTEAPASAVPVMVAPCSLALITSLPATTAMVGADGATVSMRKAEGALRAPWIPLADSTTALKACAPSDRPEVSKTQEAPPGATVAVPRRVAPSYTTTA